jgi:hypothetical protein
VSEFVARLPSTVRIGAFDIAIRKIPSEGYKYNGEYDDGDQEIRMNDGLATEHKEVNVFLHEVLHAVYDKYELRDTDAEEIIVRHFSHALLQFFRDNRSVIHLIDETLHG